MKAIKAPTTIRQVVNRFRRKSPRCACDALKQCGVVMQHVGTGMFRDVYRIVGLSLIVKFPRLDLGENYDGDDPMDHAADEVRTIRAVNSDPEYKALRRHIPRLYNFSPRTGVMLMQEYARITREADVQTVAEKVEEFIDGWDSHKDNFGKDDKGNIVILDLGYFGTLTHPQ